MTLKEKAEQSVGGKISAFDWWRLIGNIAEDTPHPDVEEALGYYKATGDESKITPAIEDWFLNGYKWMFADAAGVILKY